MSYLVVLSGLLLLGWVRWRVIVVVAVVFGILLHYPDGTFLAAADAVAGRLLPCHRNLDTFVVVLVSMHLFTTMYE